MRASAPLLLLRYYAQQGSLKKHIHKHQNNQFIKILSTALEKVPFYQRLYQNVTPHIYGNFGINCLDKLPIVDKQMMKEAVAQDLLSAPNDKTLHTVVTGGSTGKVFSVTMSQLQRKRRVATIYRTFFSLGVRPWDRIALFQNAPPGINTYSWNGFPKSAFIDVSSAIETQWEFLKQYRPNVFVGIPSIMADLANHVQTIPQNLQPKVIFSNSEMLTKQRSDILESVFGTKPLNVYDSWEFGNIAWECTLRDGLHINAGMLFLERDELNGLLITDLYNDVMPLIRYAIGDDANIITAKCACGNPYPRLVNLQGKALECIVLENGLEKPFASQITVRLTNIPGVRDFQLYQNKPGAIDVRVDCIASDEHLNEFVKWTKQTFQLKSVNINRVSNQSDFFVTAKGKRPLFYSELKHKVTANKARE